MHPPPLFFRSVYISPLLSPVHRRAVRAETRTMSTPTNPEVKELSPVDFIQLQQYIECEYRRGGWAVSQLNTPPLPTTTTTLLHTLLLLPTHTRSFTLMGSSI